MEKLSKRPFLLAGTIFNVACLLLLAITSSVNLFNIFVDMDTSVSADALLIFSIFVNIIKSCRYCNVGYLHDESEHIGKSIPRKKIFDTFNIHLKHCNNCVCITCYENCFWYSYTLCLLGFDLCKCVYLPRLLQKQS